MRKLLFLAVIILTAVSCERDNENVTTVQEKTTANEIFKRNSDSTGTVDTFQQEQAASDIPPVDPKDINPPPR